MLWASISVIGEANIANDPIVWPHQLLTPATVMAAPKPFTRGGGRSLNGIERTARTDRGFWSVTLGDIVLGRSADQWRCWNAIRTKLGGRYGLIAVPVWSNESRPWPVGVSESASTLVPHSDESTFSAESQYAQRIIDIEMVEAAAIGATVVTIRSLRSSGDLTGIRFSYAYAAYETGPATSIDGDTWVVSISPAIRAAIPAGASLQCDRPTCLCHLASDSEMDIGVDPARIGRASVSFIEATDYWSDLAAS